MRDPGLDQAIRVAGGVGALARKIGISQPSLSNWTRIPAERVLSVESLTGINRATLRPDLYGAPHPETVDEIDAARGREYMLLAALIRRAPNSDLLHRLSALRGDASPLGLAHAALGESAKTTSVEQVEREFFNLFIGIGRGELLPYGSYYLTGFLNERPLSRLRADLVRFGIARTEGEVEPEDHAALLCEIMAGLCDGSLNAPTSADSELFDRHLSPWIGHFFADLEQAHAAGFYRRVGTVGRVFIGIESEAFAMGS